MSNLILIDGPPGSGKSSLAHELASFLPEYRLLLEMDTDHPLHPMPVGAMGAGFEGLKEIAVSELSDLLLSKWSSFLAAMAESNQSYILESYPYQSHARVLWQMNASPEVVSDFLGQLHELLRGLNPLLVMLRVKDGGERTKVVFEKRGREWEEFIIELVSNTPYGSANNLLGLAGALSFLSAYEHELESWSGDWPFERMAFESWESSPAAQAREVVLRLARF